MRYLALAEVVELHRLTIEETGGASGLRDLGALESAVAQPRMTVGEEDLYPTIVDKASALCTSLVQNHPFVDGNKRVGHAVMETYLFLNGFEIDTPVDSQEETILGLASGELDRAGLAEWLRERVVEKGRLK
jgi:death-on-curing protein